MPRLAQLNAGVALLISASLACAEGSSDGSLYAELSTMDRELFTAAFISCDEKKFKSLLTDDVEFYHDKTGPRYGEDVGKLRSCPRDNGVTRTLVPESLEVYPISGYGAVQIGRHTFTREGEKGTEIAKFVHLWKSNDGKWKLARILSFDHRPAQAGAIAKP